MGKWSSILRSGKYIIANPVTKSVGHTVAHPVRSLKAGGQALTTATIGAGVGYVGWEALVNDKPIIRTVADVTIGEKTVDGIVDKTNKIVESTSNAVDNVNTSATNANSIFGGISNFIKNVSHGDAGNMLGNLTSNICHGNMSGLSIVGLIVAGLMLFCRSGWLGKIAGALLAMSLIGNNSRQINETPQQTQGLKR